MILSSAITDSLEITEDTQTTRTYQLSDSKIQGFIDDLDSLVQYVYKVLGTEKYEYPIYSFEYGIELDSLIGKDREYVKVELRRRITECLKGDSRIISVDDFTFSTDGDQLVCSFKVNSIYGSATISKEVTV